MTGEWVEVGYKLWYYFDPSLFARYLMITQHHLDLWFEYHKPTPEQAVRFLAIREAGKKFAEVILANSPSCADQSDAIRSVRYAVMNSNAAIACEGK